MSRYFKLFSKNIEKSIWTSDWKPDGNINGAIFANAKQTIWNIFQLDISKLDFSKIFFDWLLWVTTSWNAAVFSFEKNKSGIHIPVLELNYFASFVWWFFWMRNLLEINKINQRFCILTGRYRIFSSIMLFSNLSSLLCPVII